YWFSLARSFSGLEKPADIGRIAAERAVRRLGAVKVETQKVPVVFEPRTSRSLLGNIFEAVHGESIYRHSSFLTGKLGQKVASENLTVIDDGTIPVRRSEEHTSELQSPYDLVCRLLLEKKKYYNN